MPGSCASDIGRFVTLSGIRLRIQLCKNFNEIDRIDQFSTQNRTDINGKFKRLLWIENYRVCMGAATVFYAGHPALMQIVLTLFDILMASDKISHSPLCQPL